MSAAEPVATGRFYRDVFVVGDVHGELCGLRTILQHAGLLDDQDHWKGRSAHLVQCGDVVDRGPHSMACLDLLLRLRSEARHAGGRVDILVGNHELALVRGDQSLTDVPEPGLLAAQLVTGVRTGRLAAARSYRHYLMTHAGINPHLMQLLVSEVRGPTGRRVTVAAMARHLNRTLKSALLAGDFSHPMFHVGPARGGLHPSGGIFWADFDHEHDTVARHPRVWQVFGHTPPMVQAPGPFRVSPDSRRVNIDVGICGYYGGHLAYAKLLPDRIIGIHCDDDREEDILARIDAPVLV